MSRHFSADTTETEGRYADHHQERTFSPEYIASIYAEAAAAYARNQREMAEYHAAVAAEARDPLGPMPIDPTAGDVRRGWYETICLTE